MPVSLKKYIPFKTDGEVFSMISDLGEITFENSENKCILYGNIEFTQTKDTIAKLQKLKEIIESGIVFLNENEEKLPESVLPVEEVDNPF